MSDQGKMVGDCVTTKIDRATVCSGLVISLHLKKPPQRQAPDVQRLTVAAFFQAT